MPARFGMDDADAFPMELTLKVGVIFPKVVPKPCEARPFLPAEGGSEVRGEVGYIF